MTRNSIAVLWVLALAGCATAPMPPPVPAPTAAIELRADRIAGAPVGALNSDVTQQTIDKTICVSGWTGTVRPSTSYTNGVKQKLMRDQGLPIGNMPLYELDHFIPLALGGHPRMPENLWLQPWDGEWGAKAKDRLERKLQVLVCAHQLDLDSAREAIRTNWINAFKRFVSPAELLIPAEAVD